MTKHWYQEAVFYGIDVQRFADGNGDGIGDFIGLSQKLEYIRELGVTCIWLLPFFGSPDRDNGYDVSNFMAINPKVGTWNDFLAFLHRAGEFGIRVIIDLVINHTSDEHPWFQAARRDEKCRYRNYYVWSGDPPPIAPDTVSIFPGEEATVWTYDEVARSYYFHKFYHFQPELNIANPQVREEILRIIDFWLAFGVSGFRVDAAPLLIGDNGLKHADPHDPHGVLRDLASYVAERRPSAVLLGEVNMPLDQTKAYFGDSDQLHLMFNFQLACHIFAGLALESAEPINKAIGVIPDPPPGCGWTNFLRNLDELDFSQVSSDLKKQVFEAFAPSKSMQVYGRGIRRRIAPMFDGNPRRILLAFSLILSMRGPPLFVYGDEIGLGENLENEGRNAVRVPMQWTAGRNGGFSEAKGADLILRPKREGAFGYRKVNVANQRGDPNSVLGGIKKLIKIRRKSTVLSEGRMTVCHTSERSVFAHAFEDGQSQLLITHNLSSAPVNTTIELNDLKVELTVNLMTGNKVAWEHPLKVKLPPYGYCWLQFERKL